MSYKKPVLEKLCKSHMKTLQNTCDINNTAGLTFATLFKKGLRHRLGNVIMGQFFAEHLHMPATVFKK